ncbi:hypothetical protein GNI_218400, partial [Gregarina niphandrodes]
MAVTEFKRRFGVRYVLVLCDEAATLLRQSNVVDMQNFRLFRRVFTVQGITACFARTQSKVQNFAPALHRDDSWRFYRVNDMDSPYMPAPFISVSPPDIGMKLTSEAKELPPYPLALSDLHSPAWLSRFGRPLWFAFARHSLVREHLSQVLVAVAKSKMNFDTTGNSVGSLAAVMCVAALKPTPSVELAEQLVHSHMATVVHVSRNRELLYTHYPSEPYLAEASCLYLRDHWTHVLQTLLNAVGQHVLDMGLIGEAIARVCFIALGFVRLHEPLLTVAAFRDRIRGVDESPLQTKQPSGDGMAGTAVLNFNHFMKLEGRPTPEMLCAAFT